MTSTIEVDTEASSAVAASRPRRVGRASRDTFDTEVRLDWGTKTAPTVVTQPPISSTETDLLNAAAAAPARPKAIRWLPKPIGVARAGVGSKLMLLTQIRLRQHRHWPRRYPTRLEFLGQSQMAREMRRL